MIPTRLDSIPARAAVAVAVAVALAVAPGCKSDLVRVTAYDTDEAVQRERYKRLGLPWDAERARADEACVLRSPLLPDVIVGGELRSERVRATGALPCDYDIAFVGLKTIVVGIDEVTDRVMIYNDWKVLDSEARAALFEAWFRVGLTAGLEVVEAAERGAIRPPATSGRRSGSSASASPTERAAGSGGRATDPTRATSCGGAT